MAGLMPTIAEPTDLEIRAGKARSVLEYYASGVHGEWTTRAALSILRYTQEEIKEMMVEAKRKVEIAVIRADVRYVTVYKCVGCERRKTGGTEGRQFDAVEGMRAFLDRPSQSVHSMPVGWSNHSDGIRCSECTRAMVRRVAGE